MIIRDEQGQPAALLLPVTPPEPIPKFRRGDKVIAFDAQAWGGVDVGDNSRFRKPATVLRFYERDRDYFVDLLFDCGRVSRGHFARGVRRAG